MEEQYRRIAEDILAEARDVLYSAAARPSRSRWKAR